jgi:hypothetical protein
VGVLALNVLMLLSERGNGVGRYSGNVFGRTLS